MKQYFMLLAMGLHSVTAGAYCAASYEDCQRREREIAEIDRYSDKSRAEHEEYIQRTRPIQVIEPGGVRTFYPDSSGGSWVTYNPPLRSRR